MEVIKTPTTTTFEELPSRAKKRRMVHSKLPPHKVINAIPRPPSQQGVGINPLDVNILGGSQRIGIIGLPTRALSGTIMARSPGMGKSTCCMSLLVQLRHNFPVINVFSGSEADNPFYSTCIPKLFINAKVSKKGLKQFINRQRLAIGHNSPLKDALLILDDCFDHPSALDNDMMRSRARWCAPPFPVLDALQTGSPPPVVCVVRGHVSKNDTCLVRVQQYVVDLKPWARSTTSAPRD